MDSVLRNKVACLLVDQDNYLFSSWHLFLSVMSLPLSLWNKTDISFIFRARAKNPGEWLSLLTTHRPLGTRNLINVYAFLFPFVNSLVKFIILFYFVVHICVCVCVPLPGCNVTCDPLVETTSQQQLFYLLFCIGQRLRWNWKLFLNNWKWRCTVFVSNS